MKKVETELKEHALSLPGAELSMPWGHIAVKVKGKAFVFMGADAEGFGVSTKLPESHGAALMFPFASPTGYGLGKSGWVSAQFKPSEAPPLQMMKAWIVESYRAIAPKKLLAELDGGAPERTRTSAAKKKKPKPPARTERSSKRTRPQSGR